MMENGSDGQGALVETDDVGYGSSSIFPCYALGSVRMEIMAFVDGCHYALGRSVGSK